MATPRNGSAVECRTSGRKVAGSSPGRNGGRYTESQKDQFTEMLKVTEKEEVEKQTNTKTQRKQKKEKKKFEKRKSEGT